MGERKLRHAARTQQCGCVCVCVRERHGYQAGADVAGPLGGGEALAAAVDAMAVGAALALGAAGG